MSSKFFTIYPGPTIKCFSLHRLIVPNTPRMQVKDDGTLEISAVRAADVGLYVCMVNTAIALKVFRVAKS
jgi:hypothetical protein